jgi:hypothetical protein
MIILISSGDPAPALLKNARRILTKACLETFEAPGLEKMACARYERPRRRLHSVRETDRRRYLE